MDATHETAISAAIPERRRIVAAVIATLTVAVVVLSVLLAWQVGTTPDTATRRDSGEAVATVGIEDLPIIGDHRSAGLGEVVPGIASVGEQPSTGPHPPGREPKRG
jgi:hypothetical protein